MRILLLEDDGDVRETFADELRDAGHDVQTAEDGALGWTILERSASPPDVIVLDLMMPNMNGREFRIRQLADPRMASIPTVVFTGMPLDRRTRADLGLVPVVPKPAAFDVLLAAIVAAAESAGRRAVKFCTCGLAYDSGKWRVLKKIGEIDNGREVGEQLELRNCAACGSTLAWEVGVHAVSIYPRSLEGEQNPQGVRPMSDGPSTRHPLEAAGLHFRLMVEAVRDYAIFMLDPNGRVATWNIGAEQIYGYAAADIIGKPHATLLTEEDVRSGKPRALLERALAHGRYEDEGWRVRRDGSRFWADAVITVVRSPAGELLGLAKVTRDLTERRQREERHEQMRARLVLADRMVSIGTLAAGVAHEINNPLAFTMSTLETIAEELANLAGASPSALLRDLQELVSDAREGCTRVRGIVRDLKVLSRAADDRRKTVLDVRGVVELAAKMAFNEMRHRARFVKDFGDIPTVEADEARLGQVFVNLLMNAAQAIPEGQAAKNEIRVTTRTGPGGEAIIEVRDTGNGIPREALPRIFDPFFTTKDIGEGTGLGLSICHTIIVELGGRLEVESEEGQGSLFRITLPASSMTLAQPEAPSVTTPSKGAERGCVFVIDDDAMLGRSVARTLREHDVAVFGDARSALARIHAGKRPDVILCDLMMPNMTGMDLHAELMNSHPDVAARIVFLTGGAFTPASRAFLDTVPNQRLEKPTDNQQLRAVVRSFVDNARSARR